MKTGERVGGKVRLLQGRRDWLHFSEKKKDNLHEEVLRSGNVSGHVDREDMGCDCTSHNE